MKHVHFPYQAGIAIGPILFVVAILAVLVGALAAGSGGFSSSTAKDSTRTQVSALIEQGTIMKIGFDKLFGTGIQIEEMILSPAYTTANATYALFSAQGGQLIFPVPPAPAVPATGINTWRFVPSANLPYQGVAGGDLTAVIGVANLAYCQAINSIIFGTNATQTTTIPVPSTPLTPTLSHMGTCSDVNILTTTGGCNIAGNSFDLGNYTTINARAQACISDGAATPSYYYYQVLLVK